MMNNKRGYAPGNPMPQQQQQQYRYSGPGVQQQQPQGQPVGVAPRNPNAPSNMRGQNGPPRQQPQSQPSQQQLHNQQHPGVTGVSVQQHQHPHVATAQQAQQSLPQHPQQQQQMYGYPTAHNQIIYQSAAYPGIHFQGVAPTPFLPQAYPNVRFITQTQPSAYYLNQAQAQQMYHQPQNQQQMTQHQQGPHGYYPQHYVAQQVRVPIAHHGGQGVPSVQQHVPPPQVSQVHPHQPQHVPQHPHAHSQVAQPQSAQGQVVNRSETHPPVPEKKREKKILKIVDPSTGLSVIGDTSISNPVTTTEPPQISATPVEGNGDVSLPVDNSQEPQAAQEVKTEEPQVEDVAGSVTEKVGSEDPTVIASADVKSKTARAEFYQKITQASDEPTAIGRGNSSSISQNASVNSPSPTPETQAPERPESPSLDANKLQQQTPVTPIANTSSDDSKDASLVSISPTPIELYATPRSSRRSSPPPPVPLNEESSHEDDIEEQNELDLLDTSLPEPAKSETTLIDIVETSLPVAKESADENADNEFPKSISKEDFDDEIPVEIEKPESVHEDSLVEKQAPVVIHQNGDLDLEEGEIAVEEEDVGPSAAESEADDADNESSGKEKKKEKIKYDRDFLLNIGNQANHTKPDLFPDVAKDAGGNNQMRSHHGQQVSKSPSSNREPFGNRMGGRGGPGQGPKPGLMMGGNMYGGPRGGMMNWGIQPMMVPPPAPRPPKVIELTREEVKLHKAKDAWKPAAIKHRSDRSDRTGGGGSVSDQTKDEEEVITDDIVKKTRGILNKLTPENFDKLVGKFMNLQLEDKEERISKVITVVFDKAVDEPSFSKEYAKMVWKVCAESQETSKKFRKLILDQCQQEFQNSNSDEDKVKILEQQLEDATENKEQLKLELEDMKFQMRRRSLGNVRFIGELYKLQMLTPKIMVECVNMLLATSDEESLECLCKLLTTVGNKLDAQLLDLNERIQSMKSQPIANQKLPKFIPDDKWMHKTFSTLKNMSENKKLSSRIRFALLDVVELKENGWKPRRDANAPKTIDEVRRDAHRQEMEEKRQINNLPPASMADQRGGSSRPGPGQGPQQPKKGSDWNTVQSNKSSRFQVKKPDQAGSLPVLAPPTMWGRSNQTQSSPSGPPQSSRPSSAAPVAPRFMNRFQSLEDSRLNNNSGSNQPSSGGYRDQGPPTQQYPPAPSPMRRISPAPSSTSSRENSRPVSPKESSPALRDECTANINESVKNIFEEYFSVGKFDDTLHWIHQRFPGEKISEFVDELSRQVGEMSKLPQQQKAGTLVRLTMKANVVSKGIVLTTLAKGVIAELPDILIDSPMAASYLGQFLIEIFKDEPNLDWLIAIGEVLLEDEYSKEAWVDLVCKTLNLLKSKTNEEVVLSLFAKTKDNSLIPTTDLPWLTSVESLAQKMIPVLKENLQSNEVEIRKVLMENSWDLREELTSRGLIDAICFLTWKSETSHWDIELLKKLLPLLPLPNVKLFPKLWKQACEFIARSGIDQQEELWGVMYNLNLTTTIEQKNPE